MSSQSLIYVGFIDGASNVSRNLASIAWVIYTPTCEMVSLQGICLSCENNYVVEYNAHVELLYESISFGV